jgi:hypothetical protein
MLDYHISQATRLEESFYHEKYCKILKTRVQLTTDIKIVSLYSFALALFWSLLPWQHSAGLEIKHRWRKFTLQILL